MSILITGVDDQGHSCVVEERTVHAKPYESTGITVSLAAETESCPPPPRPPGHGDLHRIIDTPGITRWSFVFFPPGATTAVHHTDTLDFDLILEGDVDLILDDGPHHLGTGDGVVVAGVDHGWENPYEQPCRMSIVVIGTPPLG